MNTFQHINPSEELCHIIEYVEKTWDGVNVNTITTLWNDALEKTKFSLDAYAANSLSNHLHAFQDKFENDETPIHFLNHSVCLHSFFSSFLFGYMNLCDFEKKNRFWTSEDFEGYFESITPKYWQPLYEQYHTRDDIAKYMQDKPQPLFLGSNFLNESTFEEQTGMEQVMYFAKEQDTLPETSLAYAISRQAMLVNKNNNKVKMLNEWTDALKNNNFSLTEPLNVAWLHFMVSDNPSIEANSIFELND